MQKCSWVARLATLFLLCPEVAWAASGHGGLGAALPYYSIVPFAGLLLSIALMPVFASHFWHHTKNQLLVAVGWASPVLIGLLWLAATDHDHLGHEALHNLEHAAAEYVSFIALLGSLYVISGGVLLRGDLRATPLVNTSFLALGAFLANLVGTTGASMLLIRPMLRTNAARENRWHIPVFFIFLVSNVGGALTPIGDPPLFLGYLRGVPFFWTATTLAGTWLFTVGCILAIFFAYDTLVYRRESKAALAKDLATFEPLRFEGNLNFLLLAGVIVAVLALSPDAENPDFRQYYVRELAMAGLAGLSVFLTPRAIREGNDFTWGPILEVSALFVGIFIAMIPATLLLQTHGGALGISQPWQYFWATGALSAFLDNAPTYVTFAAMACGTFEHCPSPDALGTLAADPASSPILAAISLGAVFLGAGSYIGNGPNFMVRAIAEQSGYAMPSFFGYCGYAAMILGPVFLLVSVLWLG